MLDTTHPPGNALKASWMQMLSRHAPPPRVLLRECVEDAGRLATRIKERAHLATRAADPTDSGCRQDPTDSGCRRDGPPLGSSSEQSGLLGAWLVSLSQLDSKLRALGTSLIPGQQHATMNEQGRHDAARLRAIVPSLEVKLSRATAEIESLTSTGATLRHELASCQDEVSRHRALTADSTARMEAERREVAQRAAAFAAHSAAERTALKQQLQRVTVDLAARQERTTQLEAENARRLRTNAQLKLENTRLVAELKAVHSAVPHSAVRTDALSTEGALPTEEEQGQVREGVGGRGFVSVRISPAGVGSLMSRTSLDLAFANASE